MPEAADISAMERTFTLLPLPVLAIRRTAAGGYRLKYVQNDGLIGMDPTNGDHLHKTQAIQIATPCLIVCLLST